MATGQGQRHAPDQVTLHAGREVYALDLSSSGSRPLEYHALKWSYVLRAKERWVDDPQAYETRQRDALQTLAALGLNESDLRTISEAAQIVVRMQYVEEASGWAARVFPWEYVLSIATRRFRKPTDSEFVVLRELIPLGPQRMNLEGSRSTLLHVQSAPGRLAASWSFEGERRRLQRAMYVPTAKVQTLHNPTLAQLRDGIAEFKPALVHLSGFDNAEGLRALRELAGPQTRIDTAAEGAAQAQTLSSVLAGDDELEDGFLMTSPDGRPCVVSSLQLATALRELPVQPTVIGVSISNSAARTAALLVGEGAAAYSIGFQGAIDNSFSNYFYELLYGEMIELRGRVPLAFRRSWLRARHQPRAARATGIALWSATTIGDEGEQAESVGARLSRQGPASVDAEFVTDLNYAVLHNTDLGLFKKFVVQRNGEKPGTRLAVEVEVQLGVERASYRRAFVVEDEDRWDLTGQIHVPLTANIVRSSRETISSIVSTTLSKDGKVLTTDSKRIRLLPVDQWRDNDSDGQWLPSFVLPRDPAAMEAVQQAQRYVRVLRDDPTAGFEGYQAVDDPNHEEGLTEVDLQVQAIWSALVHEWRLVYINPPPTYSATLDSQRLRTPSAIRRNGAGTCIDLALLVAACLELVDIYPVIFLLEGHALPGYWRHDSFHKEFMLATFGDDDAETGAIRRSRPSGETQRYAWQVLGPEAHRELAARIRNRQLVPIETVRLTENCGFVDAIEAGVAALANRKDFHSMLDIVSARESGVTPLPIMGEAQ